MESPSKSKVEVIKQAIKQAMEEGGSGDGDRLLSKLMSELETDPNPNPKSRSEEEEEERILKELKKLRRQNVITHCLLSVMIIVTVAWQISEVSIIFKLKNGVTHPFRSIGSMLLTMIKRPPQPLPLPQDHYHDADDNTEPSNLIDFTPVHHLKIPMFELGFI